MNPGFAEFAGGAPTHELVKLDGIGFVTNDVVIQVETGRHVRAVASQRVRWISSSIV